MMDIATLLDKLFRRNRSLPRVRWLRDALRRPYYRFLSIGGKGVALTMGGKLKVRLPVEYCIAELEKYEVEMIDAIVSWQNNHPSGVFVDVGCSLGYMSCGMRFLDPDACVISIDADLPSLEMTRRVCSFCPDGKGTHHLVFGLVGNWDVSSANLEQAVDETEKRLDQAMLQDRDLKTNYVCLDSAASKPNLPRHSLDGLLAELIENPVPCLLKCDVEGAEQEVLKGAQRFLSLPEATLLLSVHPSLLPNYGGSAEGVRAILEAASYDVQVIAVDHEEHWLCQKRA